MRVNRSAPSEPGPPAARYHLLMENPTEMPDRILRGLRVLDGGMASELEFRGARIDGPLWSAHVLEDAPDKVLAVHRAYLEVGAEILLTASYQVSRMGYQEFGLARARADGALLRAVKLARPHRICSGLKRCHRAKRQKPSAKLLPAGRIWPHGSALPAKTSSTSPTVSGSPTVPQPSQNFRRPSPSASTAPSRR